jgi:hypothetical protein
VPFLKAVAEGLFAPLRLSYGWESSGIESTILRQVYSRLKQSFLKYTICGPPSPNFSKFIIWIISAKGQVMLADVALPETFGCFSRHIFRKQLSCIPSSVNSGRHPIILEIKRYGLACLIRQDYEPAEPSGFV